MSKLIVKESLFLPLKGYEKREIIRDDKHKELVKEANNKIKEDQLKKMRAYENAKMYFS